MEQHNNGTTQQWNNTTMEQHNNGTNRYCVVGNHVTHAREYGRGGE